MKFKQHTLSQKNSSYRFSADLIRTLAIMGVVAIHTSNAVFARPDFFGGVSWWFALIVNSVSRISIPLFIMISGYFILQKNESLRISLKRALNRIIIPLVFWFIVMALWNNGSPSLEFFNISLISRLLTVNVFDLYFFIILAGLYIVAPVLRQFLHQSKNKTQKNFMWFTLLAGVFFTISQFVFNLCEQPLSFTYWLPYTGLFVAGFVLGKNVFVKNKPLLLVTYVLSLIATVTLGYFYFLFHHNGSFLLDARSCLTPYGDYYLSLNVTAMALCAYLLLFPLQLKSLPPFVHSLIFSIARVSMGIFVLHVFFLNIFDSWLHLFDPIAPAWLYLVIKFFVIFAVSYVSAAILIKIPLVRRVFGETK